MKKHFTFRILQQVPTLHSPILVPYLVMITLQAQAFAFLCFAIFRWIQGDFEEGIWRWAMGMVMLGLHAVLKIQLRSLLTVTNSIENKRRFF